MKRRAVIEHAVGEDRAAVYEGRRLVELHVHRPWIATPRTGDSYQGRVTSVDASVAGAWVDIGSDAAPALLPFAAQRGMPKLNEGQGVDVTVIRSQIGSKGATVRFTAERDGAKPGRIAALSLKERLQASYPDITFDEASVNAVDEAVERHIALPGGGSIMLEQTQALLAIDVDKGGADSAASAANAAAKMIAVQLRLRGLGGLVVTDFPNLRQPKQRKTLERTFEAGFETDPAITKFMPLSRFGVIEMTRSKPDLSLDEVLHAGGIDPTTATQALRALRRLTREAKTSPGAKLTLRVPPAVLTWLDAAPFDWRTEVTSRIGARYSVEPADTMDVVADR